MKPIVAGIRRNVGIQFKEGGKNPVLFLIFSRQGNMTRKREEI